MAADRFRELIGGIIHACGALELLTNHAIRSLGKDSLLSREITTLPFRRRIRILRDLLHERTTLRREDVDLLCDELSKIAENRNVVAHNPIATDDKDRSWCILVVRHKFDPPEVEKVTEADLQLLLKRVGEAMNRLARSVPESS
jgi:hypothetical protein